MGYDVIILGGGANGLGTARDCAQRGLEVLLLEKGDLASGASGGHSGLIHGGPPALRADPLLRGQDAGALQRVAPHLMARVPVLLPFASASEEAGLPEGAVRSAAEALEVAHDRLQPPGPVRHPVRLSAGELYRLEPGLRPGLLGGLAFDAWGIDPHRLCVLNALAARAHGAEVRTWTEAREVVREGGRVTGVRWLDALTGETGVSRAPVVFNATGAWSPGLAARSGATVRLRLGKGVHLVLDRRLSEHAVVCTGVDGRPLLASPHADETWIGATDGECWGDPDDLEATHDEVAYLMEGAASLLPEVRRARVTRAFWALRASPHAPGSREEGRPCRHELVDHAGEGAAGLLSIVGGELASYRAQSEEATDRILALLGRPEVACRTHEVPLPGGEAPADVAALAARFGVAAAVVERVASRHGALAADVLQLCDEDPRLRLVLCHDSGLLAAEVVHCARHELVRRLRDLRTRCRLAVARCGGLDCARLAAQLTGHELGWRPAQVRTELADLLEVGWRERRAVLDGDQLRQEELLRGAHWGVGR